MSPIETASQDRVNLLYNNQENSQGDMMGLPYISH
jgi:hypothetical protein